MNREAVVRSAYWMCRALGRPTSRREVNKIITQITGKGYRPEFVGTVLKSLVGNHFGTTLEPAREPTYIEEEGGLGTTSGTAVEPATIVDRDKTRSSSSSLLRNSSSSTQRAPKQGTLGLDRPDYAARDAILKAVWSLVQPAIGRAVTYSLWKARNSRVAADLARLKFTGEQVAEAWRQASDRRGEPVRELSVVQRHIEWVAASTARPTLAARPLLQAVPA